MVLRRGRLRRSERRRRRRRRPEARIPHPGLTDQDFFAIPGPPALQKGIALPLATDPQRHTLLTRDPR